MVDFRPDARSVLVAIWEAGASEHRDTEGGAVVAKLTNAGAALDDRTLYELMFELKDGGWITFYADGSHSVAGMVLIRLTEAARQELVDWPETDGAALEPDQEQLLTELVEASREVPRHEQQWHLGGEDAPDVLRGPWGERQVLVSDVLALADLELLDAVTLNYVYGNDYVISPRGHAYYAAMKRREAQPLERQEAELRRFVNGDAFRVRYPAAYAKWAEAERLLWSADADRELSTVGHKVREASHEFALALVGEHDPPNVDPDLTKVKNRIASVIDLHRPALGRTKAAFLDALLEYWDKTVDLVQRQEHARDLEWTDARRVVFHTASLMWEIDATLGAHGTDGKDPVPT
jgi:hypothetical protein